MKTYTFILGMVLAGLVASFSYGAAAQEPQAESATWGQIKSLYQGGVAPTGGLALGVIATLAGGGSEIPDPLEQQRLAVEGVSGTFAEVRAQIERLGMPLKSFASRSKAAAALCPVTHAMAIRLVTDDGECPAVYGYYTVDPNGAPGSQGFYALPVQASLSSSADFDPICVCYWDIYFGGSHINYYGSASSLGSWNDKISSISIASNFGGYITFWQDKNYGPPCFFGYPGWCFSTLGSWNDRISSIKIN
jgi:hypothetical protein